LLDQIAMTRNAIIVGVSAMIVAYAASAQTIQVRTLDEAGAERVLQVAKENARKRNAPSAIAVVDPAGDLLAFERMNDVRPASAELAIDKARTAARLQRPTEEVENSINRGRTAFVTAGILSLRGGMPILIDGEVAGAVGIAGRSKESDTEIARETAATVSPAAKAGSSR
jgi:glc operon protein GlcG